MSSLKAIVDPEHPKEKKTELPSQMKMRVMKISGSKVEPTPSEDVNKGLPRICPDSRVISVADISKFIVAGELEATNGSKGFAIKGQDKKRISCGPILQQVKMGAYGRIGGGEIVVSDKAPIEKKAGSDVFKFDRPRQIAVRVGTNVGKDYVIVVAANGCVHLNTGAFASFHLPVFVVEQTGDYYRVDRGNRILLLGSGSHLVLYTNEAPILFVRKNTATRKESIVARPLKPKEDTGKTKKSDEKKTKEQPKKSAEDLKKASEESKKSAEQAKKAAEEAKKAEQSKKQAEQQKKSAEPPKKLPDQPKKSAEQEKKQAEIPKKPSEPPKKVAEPPKKPTESLKKPSEEIILPAEQPKKALAEQKKPVEQPKKVTFAEPPATPRADETNQEVVNNGRSRVLFKFFFLAVLFLIFLILFFMYRRYGAKGFPVKICKNCGKRFHTRK